MSIESLLSWSWTNRDQYSIANTETAFTLRIVAHAIDRPHIICRWPFAACRLIERSTTPRIGVRSWINCWNRNNCVSIEFPSVYRRDQIIVYCYFVWAKWLLKERKKDNKWKDYRETSTPVSPNTELNAKNLYISYMFAFICFNIFLIVY